MPKDTLEIIIFQQFNSIKARLHRRGLSFLFVCFVLFLNRTCKYYRHFRGDMITIVQSNLFGKNFKK